MKKLFLLLTNFIIPILSLKVLVENPEFNSPLAWTSGVLPCALDTVVFPDEYPAILPLPREVDISGMILPNNGVILLEAGSSMSLGNHSSVNTNCQNGASRKAFLKKPIVRKWFDPASWMDLLDVPKSKPTIERIPCINETVFIEAKGPFSLDLESVAFLRLGILLVNRSFLSEGYLRNFINTNMGQTLFQNTIGTRVEYYKNNVCGCQRSITQIMEPLCRNVADTCPRPHCLVPIQPLGECCDICGASVRINITRCNTRIVPQMKSVIQKLIDTKDLADVLDYHVNYVNLDDARYIEVLILDKKDYNKRSNKFMEQLVETDDWLQLMKNLSDYRIFYAGKPYDPNFSYVSFLLTVTAIFFVCFLIFVLVANSFPNNYYVQRVPDWLYNLRIWQNYFRRQHFVFSRFDNFSVFNNSSDEHNHSNLQSNIIMGYSAENQEVHERSFNNPMFGEAPANAIEASKQVEDKKESQMMGKGLNSSPKQDIPKKLDCGTIVVEESKSDEVQELTEINLETLSDHEEVF